MGLARRHDAAAEAEDHSVKALCRCGLASMSLPVCSRPGRPLPMRVIGCLRVAEHIGDVTCSRMRHARLRSRPRCDVAGRGTFCNLAHRAGEHRAAEGGAASTQDVDRDGAACRPFVQTGWVDGGFRPQSRPPCRHVVSLVRVALGEARAVMVQVSRHALARSALLPTTDVISPVYLTRLSDTSLMTFSRSASRNNRARIFPEPL